MLDSRSKRIWIRIQADLDPKTHLEGEAMNAGASVLLVGLLLGVELVEDELGVLLDVLAEEGGGVDVVGPAGVRGRLRAKQLPIVLQPVNVL